LAFESELFVDLDFSAAEDIRSSNHTSGDLKNEAGKWIVKKRPQETTTSGTDFRKF